MKNGGSVILDQAPAPVLNDLPVPIRNGKGFAADDRLEITGTNGTLRWDNADAVLHFHRMPAPFGSYSDQPPAPVIETFLPPDGFERNQLCLAQARHFIEIIRGESEPVCTLEDGIMALRLVLAAYESQETGQRITI